jgi:hypothetical protein
MIVNIKGAQVSSGLGTAMFSRNGASTINTSQYFIERRLTKAE